MNDDGLDWARKLDKNSTVVMHIPTRTVGKVHRFYDGVEDKCISSTNGSPVLGAVIEFQEGHTFLANPSEFIELAEREMLFYRALVAELNGCLRTVVQIAAGFGVSPATTNVLVIAALRAQANGLQAEHHRFAEMMKELPEASEEGAA